MPRTRTAPTRPPAAPEHPADRAVRTRDRAALPPDLHPAFDAVVAAFGHFEAGDDEAARAALHGVGLGSPFLEWKVLLRGLIAHAAGDDGRALENWSRLAPDRLPARLAAGVRNTPGGNDPVVVGLRNLRADLARDKPLTAAFRRAEQLLPALRRHGPDLVPRVAGAFYRAILSHGEPADLPRFRRAFGPPADDPDFHKLEAQVTEDAGDPEQANRHWAAYEGWLAGGPPGWPADVARRARAVVLHRMAVNAAALADDPDRELRAMVTGLFGAARPRKPTAPPDPVPLWRKAADLAPGWEAPGRALFERLTALGKPAEAEAVARRLLEHNPASLAVLAALAGNLMRAGRAAEVLDLRRRALAVNPLDKGTRVMAAYAHLAAARRELIDGNPEDATTILDAGRGVCEDDTPTGYLVLQSVIARKLGRAAEADGSLAKATAVPGGRLAAALFLAVDSTLAKLKPADRKPADAALAAAFDGPAAPLEANLLYAAWDQYHLEGVAYRGQKTQEKKVHAVILRTPEAAGPEAEFEVLAGVVAFRREWALLQKLATKLRAKFPGNPVFPLQLAEAEFAKADGLPRPNKVASLLKTARVLAEKSPEARHRDLLPKIDQLREQAVHPAYFDDFFGGD